MDQHNHQSPRETLFALCARFCDGRLSPAEEEKLRSVLLAEERNLDTFVEYMELHGQLHWRFGRQRPATLPLDDLYDEVVENGEADANQVARAVDTSDRTGIESDRSTGMTRKRSSASVQRNSPVWFATVAAIAATILLAIGLSFWFTNRNLQPADSDVTLATVSGLYHVQWATDGEPAEIGDRLPDRLLAVERGIVEISLDSGNRLVLEGPAKFELRAAHQVYLEHGRLYCELRAEDSFVVETARRQIRDVGTDFGVEVAENHDLVQVYDGKVLLETKNDNSVQTLDSMETVQIGADDVAAHVAFSAQRFVRRLPEATDASEGRRRSESETIGTGGALNSESVSEIRVARAAWPIQVDGDLREWQQDPGFSNAAEPALQNKYAVTGWLRYDRVNLYIAARVKDAHPLKSVVDPHVIPQLARSGGAVQLRISTDRSVGWPARGEAPALHGNVCRDEDRNPKLVHLTMWHFSETQTACLYAQYGMDLHGSVVNPAGFQGVFRKLPDQTGYTLEYAIPWETLNCQNDPPQSGDALPLCWNITWSDATGRHLTSEIIDVLNPDASGKPKERAATWGKAAFHQ